MSKYLICISALMCMATPLAVASNLVELSPAELAKKHACLNCHAMNKKLVGPAFKDIAVKYRGDAGAPSYLSSRVKNGGGGVWGVVAMPANRSLSDADIDKIVQWILKPS